MTADELLFFDSKPGLVPIYDALRQALGRYPDLRVKVSKTQISFYNRHLFAMASLPRRKGEDYLLVSFGLGRREGSGRVMQAWRPTPAAGHTMCRYTARPRWTLSCWHGSRRPINSPT